MIVMQFRRVGLEVHLGATDANGEKKDSKTKALFIPGRYSSTPKPPADYDALPDRHVSFVQSFVYLGTLITEDLDESPELKRRAQAAGYLARLSGPVLRNKRLSKQLRARLYKQSVQNKLLYGTETMALTKTRLAKLRKFHNAQSRAIHGSTRWHHQHQHLSMETIFENIKLDPIETVVADRTMTFLHSKLAQPVKKDCTPSIIRTVAYCHTCPIDGQPGMTPFTTQKSWAKTIKDNGERLPIRIDEESLRKTTTKYIVERRKVKSTSRPK